MAKVIPDRLKQHCSLFFVAATCVAVYLGVAVRKSPFGSRCKLLFNTSRRVADVAQSRGMTIRKHGEYFSIFVFHLRNGIECMDALMDSSNRQTDSDTQRTLMEINRVHVLRHLLPFSMLQSVKSEIVEIQLLL